ncbi:hypothetical protein HUG17_9230 [Dermatophagoides farinae]|uniref:Uncharacterized protein n=1 Tax=Dermatophagoides farinae TaxID=6954 RepID=A0A9D4SEJ0_DERFA|nr:hypothetical protein HUG17_9230 [Dermatophagoides farinae]
MIEPTFDWHKRANGFLPMRGRKSLESIYHYNTNNNNNNIFENDLPPMESGSSLSNVFGSTSSNNNNNNLMDQTMMITSPIMNGDELELMDLLEKRNRINSFMPMRGRKSIMDNQLIGNIQQQQQQHHHFVPPIARSNYYGRFMTGIGNVQSSQPSATRFLRSGVIGTSGVNGGGGGGGDGGISNLYHQTDQKRGKGVAFFGSRG